MVYSIWGEYWDTIRIMGILIEYYLLGGLAHVFSSGLMDWFKDLVGGLEHEIYDFPNWEFHNPN